MIYTHISAVAEVEMPGYLFMEVQSPAKVWLGEESVDEVGAVQECGPTVPLWRPAQASC